MPTWLVLCADTSAVPLFTLIRSFDLGFYRSNPRPFQRLCRELWPGNFAPTPSHAFFKVLDDKGKLLRCFTQNIDSLESAAGLSKDRIVAAHGNFDAAHVVGSGKDVPVEEVRQAAFGTPEDWDALATKSVATPGHMHSCSMDAAHALE